jgi:hypothetical protein
MPKIAVVKLGPLLRFQRADIESFKRRRGLTLRQIVRLAAKGYDGSIRSWDDHIRNNGRLRKDANTLDTLVTFIIRELGDVHDEKARTADQIEVAQTAFIAAITQLEGVLSALDVRSTRKQPTRRRRSAAWCAGGQEPS